MEETVPGEGHPRLHVVPADAFLQDDASVFHQHQQGPAEDFVRFRRLAVDRHRVVERSGIQTHFGRSRRRKRIGLIRDRLGRGLCDRLDGLGGFGGGGRVLQRFVNGGADGTGVAETAVGHHHHAVPSFGINHEPTRRFGLRAAVGDAQSTLPVHGETEGAVGVFAIAGFLRGPHGRFRGGVDEAMVEQGLRPEGEIPDIGFVSAGPVFPIVRRFLRPHHATVFVLDVARRPMRLVVVFQVELQARQAERTGDARFDLAVIGFLAGALDHGAGEDVGVGRVEHFFPGGEDQGSEVEGIQSEHRIEKGSLFAVAATGGNDIAVMRNAALMAQQMAHRDDALFLFGKLGHVAPHVRIEIEEAFFHQLHRGHGAERLGVRGPVVDRLDGRGFLFLAVGPSVSPEIGDPPVAQHADGNADEALPLHFPAHRVVHPGGHFLGQPSGTGRGIRPPRLPGRQGQPRQDRDGEQPEPDPSRCR